MFRFNNHHQGANHSCFAKVVIINWLVNNTVKFTLKFSYMFRLNNHHQGATIRDLLKL